MGMKRAGGALAVLCALFGAACEDDARDVQGGAGTGPAIAGSTAMVMAEAIVKPFGMGKVEGTVSFRPFGNGVAVKIDLTNCPDGPHGVHIHQGTSCADATAQGDHWDMTRGEGIPNVMCMGGTGTGMTTRPATDPKTTWTIGGPATTNVIGHAFVVHDPAPPAVDGGPAPVAPRIGCGVIEAK